MKPEYLENRKPFASIKLYFKLEATKCKKLKY